MESEEREQSSQTLQELLTLAEALEAQRHLHESPRGMVFLIQTYKKIVELSLITEDTLFSASIWVKLGLAYRDLPVGDKAVNFLQAITCYKRALRFQTPETAPLDYAQTQMNIGLAYHELAAEDQADALLQAIACFQEALRFLTEETDPYNYALLQSYLGSAYHDLETDNRPTHVMQAIACYEEALRFWTPETAPFEYAITQNNLGSAHRNLPSGNKMANLRQAITCHREALRFITPKEVPFEYALVQRNLGNAYGDLLTGKRAENLCQAIDCSQEALKYFSAENNPYAYASTQSSLASAYRDLTLGNREKNLQKALECCQEALRVFTPNTWPLDYAQTLNNLGLIFVDQPVGDQSTNLNRAIAYFQEALQFYTVENAPLRYAMTQHNLGMASGRLPTGDRTKHQEQAIACYQEALRFRTAELAPLDYAATQINLGTAFSEFLTGNRLTNLQQAITCYQEALRFLVPEASPLDYAAIQINLGRIYRNLPIGDRNANLQQAIICYQEALRFVQPETASFDYAAIQNNVGIVYLELLVGKRTDHVLQAIDCFKEALRFRTREAAPFDYAMTQTNLGTAYCELSEGDRETHIQQAIACYKEALQFVALEMHPSSYALIQISLGIAYNRLPKGERTANLLQAIHHYEQALIFFSPETAPFNYALTQANLGLSYSGLLADGYLASLNKAIACFEEVLQLWRPESFPFECRVTSRDLANLYFTQERWSEALATYRLAMDAGDQLYRVGLSAESKTAEMAENSMLYRHAAYAAVQCGKKVEGLLILERGRTRLLAESLHLRVSRPAHITDEIWGAFESATAAVRATQTARVTLPQDGYDFVQTYQDHNQRTQTALTALDRAISQVRSYSPAFLQTLDFPAILELLPNEQAILVDFCVTEGGSIGFIVGHYVDQGIQTIELPSFTQSFLRSLLADTNTDSWLGKYSEFLQEPTPAQRIKWQETITNTLALLGQSLLDPILSTLLPDVQQILFLPSSDLFLFPLHATLLPGNASMSISDRYQVSYAPSIEVLAMTRAKTLPYRVPDLYAILNPQSDPELVFTVAEGIAIGDMFPRKSIDEGRDGTKQHLITHVPGKTYLHFSCHSGYNWSNVLQSGLDLADGRFTLAELQDSAIDLSTVRLVTLSACESGMTEVMQGSAEEYVGIPAGFLLSGASCIVSSLWVVPDLPTALLMKQFYHNHLEQRMDFAESLQNAQIWVRELGIGEVVQQIGQWYQLARQDERAKIYRLRRYYQVLVKQNPDLQPFKHPYYWAAFVVNGWGWHAPERVARDEIRRD